MSKEELISEIRGITNCSINGFYEAVKAVGSNKQNILDYLDIHGCAVVTKDKLTGIPISSTAIIINEKDKEIAELKAENERLKDIVNSVDMLKQYTDDIEEYILVNPKRAYFGSVSLQDIIDLKQQLKEKDEEIENKEENLKKYARDAIAYRRELAEKDARIEKLDNLNLQLLKEIGELNFKLKSNTKQVCEKIREKTDGLWYFVLDEQKEHFEGNRYVLSRKDFDDILNLIEKGESK